MKIATSIVALLVLGSMSAGFAQEPPEMPQPTAEHKELGMWVGSWRGSGEMKPTPFFGPGGHMQWEEECSWFGGGAFHVVCNSTGSGPTGAMTGLGIVGYNAEKKVYTHYGVDSTGWSGYSEGTRSGKEWTFRSTDTMGGKTIHSRFTITTTSPTRMMYSWEMSEDGDHWTVLMEGMSEKN